MALKLPLYNEFGPSCTGGGTSSTGVVVRFNSNGATSGTPPTAIIGKAPVKITFPGAGNMVRTGYTFVGWSADISATEADYVAGDELTVMGGVNYYAVWEEVATVTATWNGDGNTGGTVPAVISGPTPLSVTFPGAGSLVKEDFSFQGWALTAGQSTAAFAAGATTTITANTTYYAAWLAD
jgi:uncharacterized repeat protein (TIGR02543 family)